MIELIDDNVGRMVEALERSGKRENTIIVFMSDHGEMLCITGTRQENCSTSKTIRMSLRIFGTVPAIEICALLS